MTKQEIYKRLEENKQNSKQYNNFGEDNHDKIDVMLGIIDNEWSYDEAYEEVNEAYHGEIDVLFEVLNGEMPIEDILFPEN